MNSKMKSCGFFGRLKTLSPIQSGRGLPQSKTLARGARPIVALALMGILSGLGFVSTIAAAEKSRVSEAFYNDWQFLQSEQTSAKSRAKDETKRQTLNVPHDWS